MQLSLLITGLLCAYEATAAISAETLLQRSISSFEAARPAITQIQSGMYTVRDKAELGREVAHNVRGAVIDVSNALLVVKEKRFKSCDTLVGNFTAESNEYTKISTGLIAIAQSDPIRKTGGRDSGYQVPYTEIQDNLRTLANIYGIPATGGSAQKATAISQACSANAVMTDLAVTEAVAPIEAMLRAYSLP